MGGSQCGDAASHPTTACIGPQRYEKSGKSTLFGTISHPAARKSARQRSGRRGGTRLRCGQEGQADGRRDSDGRAHEPGRTHEPAGHTSRRAHEPAGTRRRAADRTEGWMGGPAARFSSRFSGRFSSRFSSRLSAQHAARATRAGRRPANRPPRPGAPHPAAGCAGWSGCRSGRPAPRTRHRCGRGGG